MRIPGRPASIDMAALAVLVLATGMPLRRAQAIECELAGRVPAIARSAAEWMKAAPPALRASLARNGVVFAGREIDVAALAPLCDGVTPAAVVFDEPPEAVFHLLIQTERHGEFLSDLGGSVAISRAPADHVDRHEVRILFTSLVYHMRHHWDEGVGRIWWDLSPAHDNDLRSVVGYWELHPLGDGRTLGFYGTAVDVGPAIPRAMQARITRRNVRGMVSKIRDWVGREAGKGTPTYGHAHDPVSGRPSR